MPEPKPKRPVTVEQLGLRTLYSPSAKAGKIEVDIVAVHGIGADPDETWTTQQTTSREEVQEVDGVKTTKQVEEVKTRNWLESPDMLPKAVPKARIMRFGYESQWYGESAVKQRLPTVAKALLFSLFQERKDCKNRPIIFIGHCFGGLVIQKAYNLARANEDDFPGIGNSTTGMVFMGTPHQGTGSITSRGLMYKVIAEQLDVEDSVLHALSAGDEALGDALDEFMRLVNVSAARVQISCFFEQRQTMVGKEVGDDSLKEFVVDERSGSLQGHRSFGLPLDHFALTKFLSPEDGNFKMVKNVIHDMVLESAQIIKGRKLAQGATDSRSAEPTIVASRQPKVSYRPLSRPPFLKDDKFVSHGNILQRVEAKFENQARVALYGSSGVGKTHIAVEYAHKYGEDHPDARVLWVNARTIEELEYSYKTIGTKLSISALRDAKADVLYIVNRYLSQDAHGQWLMILEGADNQEMFHQSISAPSKEGKLSKKKHKTLLDYIPTCTSGTVLITSQSLRLASELVNQKMDCAIEITPFTREESILLVRKTLSEEVCDDQGAQELVEGLHHSPIAITQATTYLLAHHTESIIPDYLKLVEAQTLKLSPEGSGNAAESATVKTWQILYESLRQKDPEAAGLLSVISVLERQTIPIFLLNKWFMDARQVRAALSTLVQFGMVTYFANQKSISATRMVQRCTQAWLAQKGDTAWAEERALWLVTASLAEEHETCEILYPYLIRVLGFQPTSSTSKLHRADILFSTAGYVQHLGRADDARRYLADCLQLREEGLGPEDERVEETKKAMEAARDGPHTTGAARGAGAGAGVGRSALALAQAQVSKWPKASTVGVAQRFLQRAQQSLDQEQHHDAERESQEGLDACEKTLGADHSDTLQMADCLAMTLQRQGRHADALVVRTRVLDWCMVTHGPNRIETLRQTYNCGLVHDLLGQYDQATSLYQTALAGSTELLGATDPLTLRVLSSLANVYDLQGRAAEAEGTFREALASQAAILGPEHPETLLTMHNLALCVQSQGRYAEAATSLLRVLAAQERVLGPEEGATLRTASNLGLNFAIQGQAEQAEALYRLALDGQTARLGAAHPEALQTRMMLGELLENTHRAAEARTEYQAVLVEREKTLGVENAETVSVRQRVEALHEAS